MTNETYVELQFTNLRPEQMAVLMALLETEGFEGFEEQETTLKAYTAEGLYNAGAIAAIAKKHAFIFTHQTLPPQNWNAVWEQNFEPVIVHDFVGIRASFHSQLAGVQHEIVITPKMSFGTGHHATTYLMIEQMRSIDFAGKKVFDFGTGTGILAILAVKLGAAAVTAIDIDGWSIANALENARANACAQINIYQADTLPANQTYDVVLANINKNIILDNIADLTKCLSAGGILVLSGLLEDDEADIRLEINSLGLKHLNTTKRGNWISLLAGA